MPNEVVATLKGDGSAPWIVAHGDEVKDAEKILEDALAGSFFQTVAEASTLLAGAVKIANGMPPQGAVQDGPVFNTPAPHPSTQQAQQRQQVQQNQNQWNSPPAQQGSFNGTPHPQGKTCGLCGAGIVGKQPREKRMWTCPNQRSKGDGHYVEWING